MAAIYVGAALGCGAAIVACSEATVVTIGGTAYPCSIVVGGACAAGPLALRAYADTVCNLK